RPKISQMLILPPYQRKGHGRRLLKSIYNDLRNDSRVQDITESINKVNRLTKEMIDKAQEVRKLTKVSFFNEHDMFMKMYFLRSINQNDDEQMKRFRLIVKQRLFHSIQSNKHPDLQITNLEIRKIYLITQYENVLQHYEYILETFDKHYYN
ncbi:unnamed protein product, partial [Rotaria sp. Silwood1]